MFVKISLLDVMKSYLDVIKFVNVKQCVCFEECPALPPCSQSAGLDGTSPGRAGHDLQWTSMTLETEAPRGAACDPEGSTSNTILVGRRQRPSS